jgi:tRNA/tmRNA/rRNA uracil-C5-methylase (TrmA/RlmC/RlmD family)
MTPRAMAVCEEIAQRGGDFVHGTWVNAQDARNNVIFNSDGWHHATGERETHSYTPNGTKVFYLPGSFMQANAEAYGELLKRMPRHVPKNARVVEMYAGVGAIGFSLLTNDALGVKSLRCVESSSAVAEAWERTRGELPEDLRGRASLQVEKAERIAVESTKDCDVLIVDPPRKGLDAKLRAVLTDVDGLSDDLQTLLYVSCGFESFMRDSDELLASGVWQIRHHESFVFFPGTNHIEIFAVFSRTPY